MPYGQQLYKATHQALSIHIGHELESFVVDRSKARRFMAAIPFLDNMKGPDHIASVALVAALDNLTRIQSYATFCQQLGKAIERELRLTRLASHSPTEMRHLMKGGMNRSKLASPETMAQLGCHMPAWGSKTRLDVGALLADAVIQSTELFTVKMQNTPGGRGKRRVVCPSQQSEAFIEQAHTPNFKAAQAAMVCQPRPWRGLWGGGRLTNQESLIRVPLADIDIPTARSHYERKDMSWLFRCVNHLQSTAFHVTPEVVAVQRVAWEGGFEGLWPCSRAPMEPPPRLGDDPDANELKARNRLASIAHRDRETNRPLRIKIERTLQLSEASAGRDVFQEIHTDHRGRLYTGNRYVTHQGPDHEKATLDFAHKQLVDSDAIAWILKAAAGHYGLGRKSWEERLSWGWDNRDMMLSVASDPLEKMELWRSASDPWQFLQLCRGYKEAVETGRSGVPIRFDQTTSGCGILAALVRDGSVARACNLIGDTRHDLYEQVAAAVNIRLKKDLEYGDARERTLAEIWLKRGVTRALVKAPVLAVPYGGSYMTCADRLVTDLDKHLGHPPLDEFKLKVAVPAKYLASHLWAELKDAVEPVNQVKTWLKKCCRKVMLKGYVLEWDGPSGWPFLVNDREPKQIRVSSWLYGQKISMNFQQMPEESALCPGQANKALPANFTHGFDAAMVHQLVCRAEEQCVHLMTNHDCFACHPTNAGWLHQTLLETFHDLYQPSWLNSWKEQITAATGVKLPDPPTLNTLDPREIGSNPYLFS